MAKARGFLPSQVDLPVSLDVAQKSWTSVSYTSSAGLNSPEPQGTHLLTGTKKLSFRFLTPFSFTTLLAYHIGIYLSMFGTISLYAPTV